MMVMHRWRNAVPHSMRSIALLWSSMLLSAALGFGAEVVLARHLTVSEYGSLAVAMTAITLVAPLGGFGTGQFLLRSFGMEGAAARRWLPSVLRTVLIAGILCAAGLSLWASASLDPASRRVLLFLLPFLAFYALGEPTLATLQLRDRFGRLSLFQVLPHLARAMVAVSAAILGIGLFGIAGALGIAGLVLAVSLAAQHGSIEVRSLRTNKRDSSSFEVEPRVTAVLRASWPFALSAVFYLVYARSGVVLLGWLLNPDAGGVFQVAVAVLTVLHFLPLAVYNRFLLPRYHRWANTDPGRLYQLHRTGTRWMIVVGILAGILVVLVAPYAIPRLFGEEYASAANLLVLLSATVPARFASASHEAILTTGDLILRKVTAQGLAALLAVGLTVSLIPYLGLFAAAVGMLVSELTLFLLFTLRGRRALQMIAAPRP